MCFSAVQVFFCNVLSNLMVKCLNDCCHLEVAHTVESLQSFFFLFSNNNKNAHTFELSNSVQKQPKWAVFWCSDMMHIMQKKKRRRSAFLWDYTGYCVSKARGPWTAERLMFQSLNVCQLLGIWWARKSFTLQHVVCCFYIQAEEHLQHWNK